MRRGVPVRYGLVLVASTVVWVALWSDLSVANVLWGAVLGAVTLTIVPLTSHEARVTVRPLALFRFLLYFLWALLRASAIVAWEVVTPRNRIHEGIVAARLRTRSRGVATLVANVISLTPGTLTLEIRRDPPTLYVHILHLRTIDEVRGDIRHLEDLALRAFPDAEATSDEEHPWTS